MSIASFKPFKAPPPSLLPEIRTDLYSSENAGYLQRHFHQNQTIIHNRHVHGFSDRSRHTHQTCDFTAFRWGSVPVNSFLQRSRTLSSRFSSWCFTFSYSRSACWLFLLLVYRPKKQKGACLLAHATINLSVWPHILLTCSSRLTRRWTAASVWSPPGWL